MSKKQLRPEGVLYGLLSPEERDLVNGEAAEFTPQRIWNMRNNIRKKFKAFVSDLALLAKEKRLLRLCLEETYAERTNVVNALESLYFDYGPAPDYSYKYRANRDHKGQIVYWRESLVGSSSREYRRAVLNGSVWEKDFPFRGLSRRAATTIREAETLGIFLSHGKDGAIRHRDLRARINAASRGSSRAKG